MVRQRLINLKPLSPYAGGDGQGVAPFLCGLALLNEGLLAVLN